MDPTTWIIAGCAAWFAVSLIVAALFGRWMARQDEKRDAARYALGPKVTLWDEPRETQRLRVRGL